MPLTLAQFIDLLRQSAGERCESELDFLTPTEYQDAFNEIERTYRPKIIRYIARITDDAGVAEDLAQDVLHSIHKARASFERAYIFRAARNAALKELERTQRRRVLEARWAGVRRYGDKGKRAAKRAPPDPEHIERWRP